MPAGFDLRTAAAAANNTGDRLVIPAGTFDLAYPLRVNTDVAGAGKWATTVRAATGAQTPLLVAVAPGEDVSRIVPGTGLVYPGHGWFSFTDFANFGGGDICVDLTVNCPSPGGFLFHFDGSEDDLTTDIPFTLEVNSDGSLYVEITTGASGYHRFQTAAGVFPFGTRVRVVTQLRAGRVQAFVAGPGSTATVLDQAWPGSLVDLPWCDLAIGSLGTSFPEYGGGLKLPATGSVFVACRADTATTFSPANLPPAGSTTTDFGTGVFTNFAAADGMFFQGGGSANRVFLWRDGTGEDYVNPHSGTTISDLTVQGGTVNVLLASTHDWRLQDVKLPASFRYGLLALSQAYFGTLDNVYLGNSRVGAAFANNSIVVGLQNCHVEVCGYGVVGVDLTLVKTDVTNCTQASVLVKTAGGSASLVGCGCSFGTEGSVAAHGVLVSGAANVVLDGCAYSFAGSVIPPIELSHCAGGSITGPRFGANAGAPCCVKLTAHQVRVSAPTRKLQVSGEGLPWFGVGSETIPLTDHPEWVDES